MIQVILTFSFFLVALLYSSVGLGGGSSYTAIMTIFNVDYTIIPTTSLFLNLIVTFIGMINFWRGGHVKIRLIAPFLITSIPFAYLGGSLHLSPTSFYLILLISLVFVAIRIYLVRELKLKFMISGLNRMLFSLGLGASLGFIAGTAGIGGGIYLVPMIILFGLGSEKEASACGTVFIWINSLSGLIARIQRGAYNVDFILPLIVVVIIGGYLGSHYGSFRFRPRTLQNLVGIVVLVSIGFLMRKLLWSP